MMSMLKFNMRLDFQESVHKELDLIQAVIARMAHNSFVIKGWCITLTIAFLTIGEIKGVDVLPYVLACACFVFWILDAQYLRYERLFCKLYEKIVKLRTAGCSDEMYELNVHQCDADVPCVMSLMFSRTEWPLYLIMSVSLVVLGLLGFRS